MIRSAGAVLGGYLVFTMAAVPLQLIPRASAGQNPSKRRPKMELRIPATSLRGALWFFGVVLMSAGCGSTGIVHRTAEELLSDPGFTWRSDSTRHARMHYVAGSPVADSVEVLKHGVEHGIMTAHEFLGGGGDPPAIDVFIVPERRMVTRLARIRIRGGANALNFSQTRVVIAWAASRSWAGPHEYVHILAAAEWGQVNEWWLGEGLAVAAGQWRGHDVHAYASCLAANGHLYPMEDMVPQPRSGLDPRIAYPQAGSFVRYLIEQYGRDRMREIYSAGASAAQRVYGRPIEMLAEEWRAALAEKASPESGCALPDTAG